MNMTTQKPNRDNSYDIDDDNDDEDNNNSNNDDDEEDSTAQNNLRANRIFYISSHRTVYLL